MRPTLLFKYTVCYLIIIASSLLILNTLGNRMIEQRLIENKLAVLEQEASVISDAYMSDYYLGTISLHL